MSNAAEQVQLTVNHPAIKAASLWALVGITSWADFAAFVAALYSLLLIGEWLWKRILRPLLERHGILKRRLRRKEDQ